MQLEEIKKKKKFGDIETAAEMLGISSRYASVLLVRPESKKHKELLEVLTIIIKNREVLLKNNQL